MDELVLLRGVPLFAEFNESELINLYRSMHREKHASKSVIFWEEEPAAKLFVVCSGVVVVSKKLRDQVEVVLAHFRQGEFFGEMGLIDDSPRSASAQAEEKCELLALSRDDFYRLVQEDPKAASKLLLSLLRIFAARLRETNERLKDAVAWGLDVAAFEGEPGKTV